jgi:hypothetical protein
MMPVISPDVDHSCTFTPNHPESFMPIRKLIGLALWLVAFTIPFWWSLLNTDQVVYEDGRADNIRGLLSFVAMLGLLFAGYALVDSAKTNTADTGRHH